MPLGFGRSVLAYKAAGAVIPTRTPLTLTATGDAQIDTAIKQFGTASLLFDGTGDSVVTTETQVVPATGDFTVEGWVYLDNTTASRQSFFTQYGAGTAGRCEFGTFNNDGLILFIDGTTDILLYPPNTASMDVNIPTQTWKHWAVTRSGNTFSVFYDGDRIGQQTQSGITVLDDIFILGDRDTTIGTISYFPMTGNLDEIRVSSNVRYSGTTYTVPTDAFTNDEDTLLLVHGDGTDGSTTITDDGGPQ